MSFNKIPQNEDKSNSIHKEIKANATQIKHDPHKINPKWERNTQYTSIFIWFTIWLPPFSIQKPITPGSPTNRKCNTTVQLPVPIETENGGHGANRENFKETGGEHEDHRSNKGQNRTELHGPVLVEGDASEGY